MKVKSAFLYMTLASGCFATATFAETPQLPPNLEPIPEAVATASGAEAGDADVTVSKRGNDRIEEFRFKGRLYMIRVYPAVGLPYTLVDDKGDGVFNRKDARGTPIKPAQWKVLSW